MLDFSHLTFFVVAALLLLVTPGPAVLYIITRSIDQGRMAGIVSVLGIAVGTLFHVAAAALGLSALLVSSALAFNIVKYLGAAYLIYLGLRRLFERSEAAPLEQEAPKKLSHIFYQGIVVNLLNPRQRSFSSLFCPSLLTLPGPTSPGRPYFWALCLYQWVFVATASGPCWPAQSATGLKGIGASY